MALSDQEKTESPTQRRRDEARKEGRIPRSQELTTSFVLLGSALLLNVAGPMGMALVEIFGDGLRAMSALPHGTDSALNLLRTTGVRTLVVVGGWGLALMVMGLAIAAPQARGVLSTKPLEPDFSKLDPTKNIKRVVGTQSIVDLFKSLAKMGIIALVVYKAIGASWHDMMALSQQSTFGFLVVTKTYVVKLLMMSGLAYLALAAVDYAWQLWRHEQSLKMSRDEIREEMKQSEGDPLVKQRMRSFARAIARRQMMRAVPKADVVITNPTHIAVAIQYDPSKAPAPIIVAMGQRKIAEKIKKIARESGVPCIENKPIARALLASARVGQLIPAELYIAVAEILAFVIRRRLIRGKPLGELVA